jgi:hypothetical protein
MKVTLFYKSKTIDRPDESWYERGVWNIPKTHIGRIYVNAVDSPQYPVPLGYWEHTIKERRPTLRDRYSKWLERYYNTHPPHLIPALFAFTSSYVRENPVFYDCTVPDQIAEKILRKLGWKDSSDSDDSDEGDKWLLLTHHLVNETEYGSDGKTYAAIMAKIKGLPVPSTAEMQEEQAKRIYEI